MRKSHGIRGTLLCLLLYSLIFGAHAESRFDGDYVRLTKICWSSSEASLGYECGDPQEEGVAIKHIRGSLFYININTIGGNAHRCWYKGIGTMKNRIIETRSSTDDCGARIKINGNRAELSQLGRCYGYCGARASLGASKLKKKSHVKKRIQK